MPVFRWSELEEKVLYPDHSPATGSVLRGEKIAVARVRYPAGSKVPPHASRREQIHSIVRGQATYRVNGEEKLVGPGEVVLIRPNTEHAVEILQDLEVIGFQDVGPLAGVEPGSGSGPVFFKWDEMESDFITPKYSSGRGPTITGERIEVAFMFYPAGTEGKPHAHPNEQIQVALQGKVRGVIGGEEHVIEAGGGVLFPSNVEHGIKILEDYTVINCKDIVPGWSVYHARWEREPARS
ncbi:MAG TPA: cupin domain-containing protein [Methylomirabilota bacterium]|jgi:quercetin dioxygenase-like cupin family protein